MRALALLPAAVVLAACSPGPRTPPDGAEQARFIAVCTERLGYGDEACTCLSERAARRFDAVAYSILIDSMTGEPVRARMEAAGLNSSVQGALSRFVAETALTCQPSPES
ncbi:MAG TPA: hypothetical protein DF715_08870 [Oceanicaulis sp.]|jgi:hypothetical protein|uniref:Lipoprotein n=1 Tax=Glycocaulis albus TaxID=1382801 RepID=A0ABQ1XXF3_9PROT|nr:hypothetical protein [Glycocaulis albus]MBV5259316.1 hypothetical protein [Synechococcus moorigangaii CMS01]GGH05577.1 hypothetical protein GCM10007420_22600 [Glycocaulis albus]HCY55619.1 hypothetical protein [Oceanicaulis sp.]